MGEVIRLWTSRNGRWLSPKFLTGESYGTLRAAGLAAYLQSRHGLFLNGIGLVSSVLDLGTIEFTEGNDLPYVLYLPTYAAVAHYHGKHPGRALRDVINEAEAYAAGDYPRILARGHRLTPAERRAAVAKIARLTGLRREYVERVNLRIEHVRYFTELLRDRGLAVGRLDARFTAAEPDGGREKFSADPSYSHIQGPYTAALNQYVREELGYENDLPYEILSSPTNEAWSFKEFEGRSVSVVDDLGGRDAGQPVAQGPHRLRLLRRGDAALRGRARRRPPADPGRAPGQRRVRPLRGRPHDVRPRAVADPPVGRPRRLDSAVNSRLARQAPAVGADRAVSGRPLPWSDVALRQRQGDGSRGEYGALKKQTTGASVFEYVASAAARELTVANRSVTASSSGQLGS